MSKHPFRITIENGASQGEVSSLLAPGVVLMAPMLSKPVAGPGPVANVLACMAQVAGPIEYTLETADPRQTFLI